MGALRSWMTCRCAKPGALGQVGQGERGVGASGGREGGALSSTRLVDRSWKTHSQVHRVLGRRSSNLGGAGQGAEGAPCVGKATAFRLYFQDDAPCTEEPALVTGTCLQRSSKSRSFIGTTTGVEPKLSPNTWSQKKKATPTRQSRTKTACVPAAAIEAYGIASRGLAREKQTASLSALEIVSTCFCALAVGRARRTGDTVSAIVQTRVRG